MKNLELAFRDVERLRDDWDTYGAKAPNALTIKAAKDLCDILPDDAFPEITPNTDGSISIYYSAPNQTFIVNNLIASDNPNDLD